MPVRRTCAVLALLFAGFSLLLSRPAVGQSSITTVNQPPILTYIAPGNGATKVSLDATMSWSMADPDGGYVFADFYFGTGEPLTYYEPCLACGFYRMTGLAYNTTYYWRVRAYDNMGGVTVGPTWSFTTLAVNHPPNEPSNPHPPSGTAGLGIQPLLSWDATTDPDSGQVVSFDVYLGRTLSPPLSSTGRTVPFAITPDPLLSNTQYFWRIVAKDPLGGQTSGPVWTFITGSKTTSQPPTAPSNPYPPDGSVVNAQTVDLQWTASDPEGQPLTYIVWNRLCYCAGNYTFAGIRFSPSFTMGPLVPGRTYYWSVFANNGFHSTEGPVWSFTAGSPPVPVLFSRFEAISTGSAARIEWELQSDESMESYTVFRRGKGASPFVPITTAAVAQSGGSYLDRTVEPARSYEYQLLVRTRDGDEFRSQLATITTPRAELTLGACHPNPFNPQTTIPYTVPAGNARMHVRLVIYDTAGRMVRALVDEEQAGGARSAVWKGDDASGRAVSSGIYFCVLQAGKERRTQKLVLLK